MFCANTADDDDDDDDNNQDNQSEFIEEDTTGSEEPNAEPTSVIDETESSVTKTLEELIEEAYGKGETVQDIVAAKRKELRKLPLNLIKSGIKLAMGELKLENDKLYVKGRLYVPDYEPLQLHLLKKHHEPPLQGHPGYKSMYQIMRENYFWFEMKDHCKRYAVNYSVCRRSRAYNSVTNNNIIIFTENIYRFYQFAKEIFLYFTINYLLSKIRENIGTNDDQQIYTRPRETQEGAGEDDKALGSKDR